MGQLKLYLDRVALHKYVNITVNYIDYVGLKQNKACGVG